MALITWRHLWDPIAQTWMILNEVYWFLWGHWCQQKRILGHIPTTKPKYRRRSSTVLVGKRLLLKIRIVSQWTPGSILSLITSKKQVSWTSSTVNMKQRTFPMEATVCWKLYPDQRMRFVIDPSTHKIKLTFTYSQKPPGCISAYLSTVCLFTCDPVTKNHPVV